MRAVNAHHVCCVQVDTRDILFVVGGAFVHLEKLLMDSRHKSSIGFGNKVRLAAGLALPGWQLPYFFKCVLVSCCLTCVGNLLGCTNSYATLTSSVFASLISI
jgi:hypothetical protein